jgi:hypothetical protein
LINAEGNPLLPRNLAALDEPIECRYRTTIAEEVDGVRERREIDLATVELVAVDQLLNHLGEGSGRGVRSPIDQAA